MSAVYHRHWDLKPFAFDPPGDWEHGEWTDVRIVWFHRISKNDLHFAEYTFSEYPAPGFYARAAMAFRDYTKSGFQ